MIVTDYNMPFMDGSGLVGYLKQNPSTASVPIIMVTTEQDPVKLDAVRQLGVPRSATRVSRRRHRSEDHRPTGENAMNEVVREFLIETHENLAQLDLDLVTLEKDPTERETLARVFRTLHTVKGTAGFLGLHKLQAVAHAAENLLSRLRDGDAGLQRRDRQRLAGRGGRRSANARRRRNTTENEGDGDFSALIQTLERLHAGRQRHVVLRLPRLPGAAPLRLEASKRAQTIRSSSELTAIDS